MENRLETNAPEKLWNASYIFALVVSTFTAFSFYMNQSMLAGYLQSDGIGLTAQLAGVIVGLFSMTLAASATLMEAAREAPASTTSS